MINDLTPIFFIWITQQIKYLLRRSVYDYFFYKINRTNKIIIIVHTNHGRVIAMGGWKGVHDGHSNIKCSAVYVVKKNNIMFKLF